MGADLLRLRESAMSWRAVDDEVVVLTEDERYVGVNSSGAKLWKALAEGATRDQLVGVLVEEGASDDQAASDLDAFLADLQQRGLLEA